jgi:hypothetical protein
MSHHLRYKRAVCCCRHFGVEELPVVAVLHGTVLKAKIFLFLECISLPAYDTLTQLKCPFLDTFLLPPLSILLGQKLYFLLIFKVLCEANASNL